MKASLLTLLLLTVCYRGMEASGKVIECGRGGDHAHIDRIGCKDGGLGCNAYGQKDCRLCGFGPYRPCGGH